MGYYILNLRQSISESVKIRVMEDAGKSGGKIPSSWAVADTILGGFIGFNVGAIAGALIGVDIAYGGFGIGSAIGAGLLVGTIIIAEYYDVMPNNFHIFGITSGEFSAGLDFKKRQDKYAIDLTLYYKSLEEIKQQKITYEDSDDSFEQEKAGLINESVYLQDNPEMLQLEMMQIKALLYTFDYYYSDFTESKWASSPTYKEIYDTHYNRYISNFMGTFDNTAMNPDGSLISPTGRKHDKDRITAGVYYDGTEEHLKLDPYNMDGATDFGASHKGVEGDTIYLERNTIFNLTGKDPQRWYKGDINTYDTKWGERIGVGTGFTVTGQYKTGMYVAYGHLQPNSVVASDFGLLIKFAKLAGIKSFVLPAGVQIGNMGNTGGSSGPHLHHEISPNPFNNF